MKIEYDNKIRKNYVFGELTPGDIFKYKTTDYIFMVVEQVYGLGELTDRFDGYAVCLDDGDIIGCRNFEEVVVLESTLTITKIVGGA